MQPDLYPMSGKVEKNGDKKKLIIYLIYLTASGLLPGGSGYFTFKLRQTY
jgi:hypothetical protein